MMPQRRNQPEFDSAALRQAADREIRPHVEPLQQRVRALLIPLIVELPNEGKELPGRERGVEARVLRKVSSAQANLDLVQMRLHAEYEDAATVRADESPEQPQQCGLAGAV